MGRQVAGHLRQGLEVVGRQQHRGNVEQRESAELFERRNLGSFGHEHAIELVFQGWRPGMVWQGGPTFLSRPKSMVADQKGIGLRLRFDIGS